MHSENFNTNISLLIQIKKTMAICASLAKKSNITLSKKSRDDSFLYTAPKRWNNLPNNINSQCSVNTFHTDQWKYFLTATV